MFRFNLIVLISLCYAVTCAGQGSFCSPIANKTTPGIYPDTLEAREVNQLKPQQTISIIFPVGFDTTFLGYRFNFKFTSFQIDSAWGYPRGMRLPIVCNAPSCFYVPRSADEVTKGCMVIGGRPSETGEFTIRIRAKTDAFAVADTNITIFGFAIARKGDTIRLSNPPASLRPFLTPAVRKRIQELIGQTHLSVRYPISRTILSQTSKTITLFPNPSTDVVPKIEFNEPFTKPINLKLLDAYGRLVYQNQQQENNQPLMPNESYNLLPKGFYHIQTEFENKLFHIKFIKN